MAEEKEPAPTRPSKRHVGRGDAKSRRVWCAYNKDGSAFVLFGQELQAMRYAVDNHLDGCKPVEFGVPLLDQIK
jgi:hypothetical protein